MKTKRLLALSVVGVAASAGLAVTGPVAAAADTGSKDTASAAGWSGKKKFDTGYHPQCRGWYKALKPYKTGKYIKTGRQIHCNKGGWGRKIEFKVELQQYRGLGVWRSKAKKNHKDGNASHALTKKLVASWKCSGGSQLYRTKAQVHAWSVLRGSQTRSLYGKSDQKRIRC
ncbi:hypothetical protein SMC26_38075 [Actinomadura fulvescens]|uniref:Secreted protein n=1 Tax=Actinomadura fulvescens TaxID=46160 RepID=A0ABN3QDJ0_9ACTN